MAKKNDKDRSDKDRIKGGELLLRVILEVAGSPKDHIEKAISLLVDKLEEKEYLSAMVSEEVFEAEQHPQHEQIFTAIAEIEFWLTKPAHLVDLAFDFMPASIEVVEPERPEITNKVFTGLLNEMMAKLHKSDMFVKNMSVQKQVLERNSNILLRNFIVYDLKKGDKSLEEISKSVGVPGEQLQSFLSLLEKGKELKVVDGKYSLIKGAGKPAGEVPEKPAKKSTKKSSKK